MRERGEIARLLGRAYRVDLSPGNQALDRLIHGLGTVAAALNANDPAMARIAAVHLRIPDLPDRAARDAMETEDRLIKSIDWNPALHPRAGTPPNPGWFAPTDGAGGESSDARTVETAASEDVRVASLYRQWWELLFGRKDEEVEGGGGGGTNRGGGGYGGERAVPPGSPRAGTPELQANTRSLDSILAPGGEPIGYAYRGAGDDVRTVSPAEFDALASELLSGAARVRGPDSYDGLVFERLDGSLIGIRNSTRYGRTIDVLKSNSPIIPNGFRIHQR